MGSFIWGENDSKKEIKQKNINKSNICETREYLDENLRLNFRNKSGYCLFVNDKLIDNLTNSNFSFLPLGTKASRAGEIKGLYQLDFADGSQFKFFSVPVFAKIKISKKEREIPIYSLKHLKLILEKYKTDYTNPYYYSSYFFKDIFLNYNNLNDDDLFHEAQIEIKEKEEENYEDYITKIFIHLNSVYMNYKVNSIPYSYEYLSINFNIYFPMLTPNKLDEIFPFYFTKKRKELIDNVLTFLKKDEEKIFPICGPHNTGKSITALFIQKYLYEKGIKSVYINLKYYFYEPLLDFDKKIATLIKECFFFIQDEKNLSSLYKEFKYKNSINEVVLVLINHLKQKNYKNFFIIIDQFQMKYDLMNILDIFSGFKIFLLSSINDRDVKTNLIFAYKERYGKNLMNIENESNSNKDKIIKYIYIEDLFDFKAKYSEIFEEKIRQKIESNLRKNNGSIDQLEVQRQYNFINYILTELNYNPKYYFGFIFRYNSIYDLVFNEYSFIFLKLIQMEKDGTIKRTKIKELLGNSFISDKPIKNDDENIETILNLEKFIYFFKHIPLKYINHGVINNEKFYYYYAFPFFKNILTDFNDYFQKKYSFLNEETDGTTKGIDFEYILKIQFKVFNYLNIDGHFEVDTIFNMNLTKNYELFDKNYFKDKKCVFFSQKTSGGRDYDFAIYYPKDHKLLLMQSKYKIEHNLIKSKNEYVETAKIALNNFIKSFKDNHIVNVYLLYISSIDYNENQKNNVNSILEKNQINCIFYSVKHNFFSFNMEKIIENIGLDDSFMILPKINEYESQNFTINIRDKKFTSKKLLIGRKTERKYNKEEILKNLIKIINKKNINFNFLFGEIEEIKYIPDSEEFKIEFNWKENYAVLFSLKEDNDSEIDSKKPIGITFYENNNQINYEFKANKTYKTFNELIKNFIYTCFYATGKKIVS